MIRLQCLSQHPSIRHGFMTREGGVSSGIYASLNCGTGSGDDADHVAQNRALALGHVGLPLNSLVTAHQVHGKDVRVVDEVWPRWERPRIDAMVTRRSGISLGILTADCVPVLFADPRNGIIAAAHAGWRGALNGVLENAVGAMLEIGARPEDIAAGIGPAIQQASYEVGPEFPDPFVSQDIANARWFQPGQNPGRWQFDLVGYVTAKLDCLGIARIESAGLDTCAEERLFFSHRRMVHRRETDYGRQLSVIGLI